MTRSGASRLWKYIVSLGVIVGLVAGIIAIVDAFNPPQPEQPPAYDIAVLGVENVFREAPEEQNSADFAASVLDHSWRNQGEPFLLHLEIGDFRNAEDRGISDGRAEGIVSPGNEARSVGTEFVDVSLTEDCLAQVSCALFEFAIRIPALASEHGLGVESDHPMLAPEVLRGSSSTESNAYGPTGVKVIFSMVSSDPNSLRITQNNGHTSITAYVSADYVDGGPGVQRWLLRPENTDPLMFGEARQRAEALASRMLIDDQVDRILEAANQV